MHIFAICHILPNPVGIPHRLRGTGNDQIIVFALPKHGAVTLVPTARIQHPCVNNAAWRDRHIVRAKPLQERLRILTVNAQLSVTRLIEQRHGFARCLMLRRNEVEKRWSPKGRRHIQRFAAGIEEARPFPPHALTEMSTLLRLFAM